MRSLYTLILQRSFIIISTIRLITRRLFVLWTPFWQIISLGENNRFYVPLIKRIIYYLDSNKAITLLLLLPRLDYVAVIYSFNDVGFGSAGQLISLGGVLCFHNTGKDTWQNQTLCFQTFNRNDLPLLRTSQPHHHILLKEVYYLFVPVSVLLKLAFCAVLYGHLFALLETLKD